VRLFAICAVLVAAFAGALLVGRSSGDSGQNASASAEVTTIDLPKASTQAPQAKDPGTIPDLKPKPQVTSTPTTGSTPTASAQSSTPSTGSSPPASSGGGGETPPPPVGR
jgi:hypothetical protein